jgi:hypothetical protein
MCNLANNIGGWPPTMGIRNFNLWRSQVRKWGTIGLNQSLVYTHPFPHFQSNSFYLPLFNSVPKIKLFLGTKNKEGAQPHLAPSPNYAYAISYFKTKWMLTKMFQHI